MSRITSKLAYEHIKSTGLLSTIRWTVYDWLYHNGPATASEVFVGIKAKIKTQRNDVASVLSKLRDTFGVVKEVKVVSCPITGMKVIQFDVTSKMPEKKKPVSRLDKLYDKKKRLLNQLSLLDTEIHQYTQLKLDIFKSKRKKK